MNDERDHKPPTDPLCWHAPRRVLATRIRLLGDVDLASSGDTLTRLNLACTTQASRRAFQLTEREPERRLLTQRIA